MAKKRKAQKGRQPGGTIRVQIPASVGFKLGELQKSVGNLAERLGCPECFSGFDCTFSRESRFAVDPDTLKIDTVPLPESTALPIVSSRPAIGTWPTPERTVNILVPAKVANDLKVLKKSIGNLAEELGCRECFSGFDCAFSSESRYVIDADTLKIDTVPLPD